MDARHLALLRELAERGSVAAVAEATHRTPSAVSQQLRTMQRELDARLVEPLGRGVRLTDAGRLLAGGAVDVATALARVQARWDAFTGDPIGEVSVNAFPSAAEMLFPPLLAAFAGTGVDVRCHDDEAPEDAYTSLVADHDVVVGHSLAPPPQDTGLTSVALMREPLDVAVPPDHRLADRAHVRPADLVDERWIGVPSDFPFDTVLRELHDRTGRPALVTQRLRHNRGIEALVAAGIGIAMLPRYTTAPGSIRLVPLRGVRAGRHVTAWMRPDRAERLAVRTVVDVLSGAAADVVARQRAA